MAKPGESVRGHDFGDVTQKVIGCAIAVHKELGSGFQEVVYQRALALELQMAGVEHQREQDVKVYYKGKHIDTRRVDFVIEDSLSRSKRGVSSCNKTTSKH